MFFPTLVEDSLKRFKNPVAGILETLLQEEAVKEKIVDSAVSHYRVASRDTAKKAYRGNAVCHVQ